jgi:hypothetical protein
LLNNLIYIINKIQVVELIFTVAARRAVPVLAHGKNLSSLAISAPGPKYRVGKKWEITGKTTPIEDIIKLIQYDSDIEPGGGCLPLPEKQVGLATGVASLGPPSGGEPLHLNPGLPPPGHHPATPAPGKV